MRDLRSQDGALYGLARRLAGPQAPAVLMEFADWAEAQIAGQTPVEASEILAVARLPAVRLHGDVRQPLVSGGAMILGLPCGSEPHRSAQAKLG
jgi:hypothetical protein